MTVARRTRIVRACNLSGGSTRGVAINHTRRSTLPSQRASPMARRGSTVTGPPEPGRTSPSDVGQNHGQGARTGRARATPAHLATKHFANATPAPTSHGPPTRVQHSAQLPTGHHAHGARDRAPHPLGPQGTMCGQVHPQPRGQDRTVRSATSPSTSTSTGHRLGAVALWRRRPCGRVRRCAQVHARVRTDIDVESPTPAALGTGEWVQSSVRLRHHARHGHVRTRPRALAHRRRRPPAFNRGFKAHPPVKEPWGQPGTTPGTTTVVLTAQATRRGGASDTSPDAISTWAPCTRRA